MVLNLLCAIGLHKWHPHGNYGSRWGALHGYWCSGCGKAKVGQICEHQDWYLDGRRVLCLLCSCPHPDPKNWIRYGSYHRKSTYPKAPPTGISGE